MFNKQKSIPEIDDIIKKSVDFEVTLTQITYRSEKRAWLITACCVLITLMLVIAFVVLLPLKEKVPYVIMADPYTGTSSISRLSDNFAPKDITSSEAIAKSNVAHFIIARESYDWDLIGRRDWTTVHSMGTQPILQAYRDIYSPSNPLNPDKIYAQNKTARVKIKTITLSQDETRQYNGATVRFDIIIINKQDERIESGQAMIATVAFSYANNLKMTEELRFENPLGFRVFSYRVDPESGTPSKAVVLKEVSQQGARTNSDGRPQQK